MVPAFLGILGKTDTATSLVLVLLYVWVSYFSVTLLLVVDPCIDGVMNYDETDIDCGGSLCPSCQLGEVYTHLPAHSSLVHNIICNRCYGG